MLNTPESAEPSEFDPPLVAQFGIRAAPNALHIAATPHDRAFERRKVRYLIENIVDRRFDIFAGGKFHAVLLFCPAFAARSGVFGLI